MFISLEEVCSRHQPTLSDAPSNFNLTKQMGDLPKTTPAQTVNYQGFGSVKMAHVTFTEV